MKLFLCLWLYLASPVMAATTYYSENFEAYSTGSALTANPPNFTYTYFNTLGTYTVETAPFGSKAARIVSGTFGSIYCPGTFAQANLYVQARFSFSSVNKMGIKLRATPNNCVLSNGEYFLRTSDGQNFYITKVFNTCVTVGDFASYDYGSVIKSDFTMALEVIGNTAPLTLNGYINGNLVMTGTDNNYIQPVWTTGSVGFDGSYGTVYVDDIVVSDGPPPTATPTPVPTATPTAIPYYPAVPAAKCFSVPAEKNHNTFQGVP